MIFICIVQWLSIVLFDQYDIRLCNRYIDGQFKMVKAKVYKYVREFDGLPKETDFKIVEEELEALKDGGIYFMRISNKTTSRST